MTDLSVAGLRTDGFAALPYPVSVAPLVDATDRVWEKFLTLPDAIRNKFPYLKDNLRGNSGTGYEPPDPKKWDARKHTFHAKAIDAKWMREQAHSVDPIAVSMVEYTLALLEALKPYIKEFADAFEREFPGTGAFTKDMMDGFPEWILRLLDYPPGYKPWEVIAAEHCDKGGGTLHLRETCAGVERLTKDGRWVPFPVGDGQAVAFCGMRMQHRTRCEADALCHRVIATPETAEQGRRSMVLFLNFENTPYYHKGRFGSTQNLPAGFNYGMPFETFAQYFAEGSPKA